MTGKKARTKKTAAERQEQIVKAAGEVFTRRGYAAATVPEIAALAGVAVGTIYKYYPGKRELFITVIKDFIITVPLLDLIEKIPEGDIETTFRQILHDRFNLIDSEIVARIPSLMGEIQRDPELKTLWAEQFLRPFLSRMEGMFRFMIAEGKVRRMEPSLAPRIVGGLILGFLMLRLMEGETSPLSRLPRDEVAGEMMGFVFRGLMNDNGRPKPDKEVKS